MIRTSCADSNSIITRYLQWRGGAAITAPPVDTSDKRQPISLCLFMALSFIE